MYDDRTDLICELMETQPELTGLSAFTSSAIFHNGIQTNRIHLTDPHAARRIGKRPGRYHTVECRGLENADGETLLHMIDAVAAELNVLLGDSIKGCVFVVGLGNTAVTPDALGPKAVNHIVVTRHIKAAQTQLYHEMELGEIAALAPGVLGQTGVESAEIIRGVADHIKPSAIIVIDSLMAVNRDRLCATVQLSDSGITPGSGVGNHRFELSRESMNIPVVAVGIPMVISSRSLTREQMQGERISSSGADELIVTPKGIDLLIGRAARLLGYAINRLMHKNMTVEDMDSLLS